MDGLAHYYELRYNLPHGTCRAFGLQESNYDSTATRVETGYFNEGSRYARQIARDATEFLNSRETDVPEAVERLQRSTSFGMYQIMGQNFRRLGYTEEFIAPTLDEQFQYFALFVAPLFHKYKSLAKVASMYNTGSPNKYTPYVRHIVQYQKKFRW